MRHSFTIYGLRALDYYKRDCYLPLVFCLLTSNFCLPTFWLPDSFTLIFAELCADFRWWKCSNWIFINKKKPRIVRAFYKYFRLSHFLFLIAAHRGLNQWILLLRLPGFSYSLFLALNKYFIFYFSHSLLVLKIKGLRKNLGKNMKPGLKI